MVGALKLFKTKGDKPVIAAGTSVCFLALAIFILISRALLRFLRALSICFFCTSSFSSSDSKSELSVSDWSLELSLSLSDLVQQA